MLFGYSENTSILYVTLVLSSGLSEWVIWNKNGLIWGNLDFGGEGGWYLEIFGDGLFGEIALQQIYIF